MEGVAGPSKLPMRRVKAAFLHKIRRRGARLRIRTIDRLLLTDFIVTRFTRHCEYDDRCLGWTIVLPASPND